MPRINFISKQEIVHFELPYNFTHKEQQYFFVLPKKLEKFALSLESNINIIIFILLYGHFKSNHKFYSLKSFTHQDMDYICKKYTLHIIDKELYLNVKTLNRYKKIITHYFRINDYTQEIKNTLQKEANNLANNFIHRKKIFYTLIELSKKLNIEVPSYTELTRIIIVALNTQKPISFLS